jgi:hypothetical protein
MTGLLEQAVRRAESLSAEQQDAIASQIIESIEEEEAWARRFRQNPDVLRSLAREAIDEHRRGETRPLDEFSTAWQISETRAQVIDRNVISSIRCGYLQ